MTEHLYFYTPELVDQALRDLGRQLTDLIAELGLDDPLMLGIATGGVWVAQRLYPMLGLEEPLGMIDVTPYRDDVEAAGITTLGSVVPADAPVLEDCDDRAIILVDDIIHTGRTARAAMQMLFELGRPASVLLVTLVDRAGRELPIEPDLFGLTADVGSTHHLKLTGPDPLAVILTSYPHTSDGSEDDEDYLEPFHI